eukprot:NODE_8633_length_1480_cov_7.886179.p1 GENE.NODE_8633_length_1480_cov_7.886179~~NODE_8633_length_1480_cov_7.886179.p1  ORF type:complete len:332 (-),score=69.17 NODE_8633_length_1480_cov_7.886179:410-1405(-)
MGQAMCGETCFQQVCETASACSAPCDENPNFAQSCKWNHHDRGQEPATLGAPGGSHFFMPDAAADAMLREAREARCLAEKGMTPMVLNTGVHEFKGGPATLLEHWAANGATSWTITLVTPRKSAPLQGDDEVPKFSMSRRPPKPLEEAPGQCRKLRATLNMSRTLTHLTIVPEWNSGEMPVTIAMNSISVLCPASAYQAIFSQIAPQLNDSERTRAVLLQYVTPSFECNNVCFLDESGRPHDGFILAFVELWLEKRKDTRQPCQKSFGVASSIATPASTVLAAARAARPLVAEPNPESTGCAGSDGTRATGGGIGAEAAAVHGAVDSTANR